ncbi:MAG: MBOAT family protein [Oscillospiraceae bacterium]|nr:MBOAT family protein [Oscillospiraceae bacterium]
MLFSGIPFLFYFLPIVVIVYFLMPEKGRNLVLLLASLFFYAWGEPKYLALMVFSILAFYGFGLAVGHSANKKLWLWASVVTAVLLLGIFKYSDFFIGSFNAAFGLSVPLLKLALPIGISFYTFQCMSYVVDVYRGDTVAQKNIIHFATYVSLFPQLIAGPIVRYVDVDKALEHRPHGLENLEKGLPRFLIGLGKKVILANNLGLLTQVFREAAAPSVLFYWMYAIAFTLHIYFDFSGYSDMAIGLGRIFGFRFPENFNYPYISGSITEFWRRWHMTLSYWFRDYVYIPLGGNRVSKLRWVGNILAVWLLTGLWHGAAWNFVLWGLLFALALMAEKWIPALKALPGALRHGYVLLVVVLSFVLFNAESLSQAATDIVSLFGAGRLPLSTPETLYYLRSYGILFAISALGATPLPKRIWQKLAGRATAGRVLAAVQPIALALLLLICTAYLVDGSFNPFLYFRF